MTGIELGLPRRWRCSMVTMLAAIDAGHVSALAPASLDSLGELSGYWEQSPRSAAHDATQDARCCLHGYQWLIQKLTNQESTAVETAAAGAGIDLAAALESRKKRPAA